MHPVELERQRAFAAAARHRVEEGLQGIRRLLRAHPDHPLLLLDLAELSLQAPDRERALRAVEKAAPQADARLLPRLAQLWHRLGHRERGLAVLEKAAAAAPELRLEWARALERLNRTAAAVEALAGMPASAKEEPEVLWLEARLRRREGRYGEALERLQALAARRLPSELALRVGHEAAAAREATGDFAEAFRGLMAAKKAYVASLPKATVAEWDRRLAAEQEVREALAGNPALLERWQSEAAGPVTLPALTVLTGLPRSGTTLIESRLARRQGFAGVSEEQIFRTAIERITATVRREGGESPLAVLDRLPAAIRARARALYRSFLGVRAGAAAVVDKEPSYFDYLPVLLRFAPELRVLVVERQPGDVLVSSLFVAAPVNNVSAWAWLDPVKALRRMRQVQEAWARLRPAWPGPLMEVRYEDFVREPGPLLERMAGFVGLDGVAVESPGDEWVSSPSYERVGQAVDERSVGRWELYRRELEEAGVRWED